jgi:glycosyltransferase involved in cell wall biosynthesis
MLNVAILHPIDPAGHVPSGIDAFIRGILKFAPPDIHYTLFGATSDPAARPPGQLAKVVLGGRAIEYWPLVTMDARAERGFVPLTIRYMYALHEARKKGLLKPCNVLDFHRIEPSFLFSSDPRPKNVLLHQDMSVIRDRNSDILWRHAPWMYEFMEKRAFARMRHIFAVRQSAVQRYKGLYPNLADRFSFIPTWVDSTVFLPTSSEGERLLTRSEFRSRNDLPGEARLLVFVGRLDQQKDPLLLIEALESCVARNSRIFLLIVGDGVLRFRVEDAARARDVYEQIRFLGVRPPAQIAEILRAADLYVLSSAYEGMPIAVLEALATGLPVASTDVGEVRLVVKDGVNGRISADRSAGSFAEAIMEALNASEELRGVPCESAVKDYQPERVLEKIYANHRLQAGKQS